MIAKKGRFSARLLGSLRAAVVAIDDGGCIANVNPRVLHADARIISATSADFHERVQANAFRRELLDVLAMVRIQLPLLRNRSGDVRGLCHAFLDFLSSRLGPSGRGFTPMALRRLGNARRPGNVGKLRNVIERAILLVSGSRIQDREFAGLAGERGAALEMSDRSRLGRPNLRVSRGMPSWMR
ncbi:hypothetical protein MK489_16130 [Myxococcota bacterium]|nr:hypothetical protein [Myxococcota bacterium]